MARPAAGEQNPGAPTASQSHGQMQHGGIPSAQTSQATPQAGEMQHGQMQHGTGQPGQAPHDMSKMPGQAPHDMGKMGAHEMTEMMTTETGGPFKAMEAIGSGTSLQPATTPGYMRHWMKDGWMVMLHGDLKVGFNHQGGPRGVNKAESQNWIMAMAERKTGRGRLMLRGMFSAEPRTTPNGGFPELLQTGETYKGRPIIDAQHPHDLFMELAAGYTLPVSENVSFQFYGGPVAEPAIGPVAFMHRPSAMENPAAPLGHHLQDSTHIAHGVLTGGVTAWRLKFESSIFRGAEPDENRKDIELGKLDSWSARAWFTPFREWTMQFSGAHLKNPEKFELGDLDRLTASIAHTRNWDEGHWATTLIWGRNHEERGNFNSYLLESTVNFQDKNYAYGRLELVDKKDLLAENIFGRRGLLAASPGQLDRLFRVGAFTLGGVRDIIATPKMRLGIGGDITAYHVPRGLKAVYDSNPISYHLFIRIRPGKMTVH
ncbi:MAG TPA: hypothetical protein VGK99_18470 [Acidobacteriota bacterium]